MITHVKWGNVISGCEEFEVWVADGKVNQKMTEDNEESEGDDDSRSGFQGQLGLERRVFRNAVTKRWLGGRSQERYVVLRCVRRWRGRGHDDRWQRRLFRDLRKR
jgi:hypothetical protein